MADWSNAIFIATWITLTLNEARTYMKIKVKINEQKTEQIFTVLLVFDFNMDRHMQFST